MRFLFTIQLLLIVFLAAGQGKGMLEGRVLDAETKEALIGVNIMLAEGLGTTTDIDGNFRMALTEGSHELTFSYIGYETVRRTVLCRADETVFLSVEMQYESIEFDEIVVSGSRYAKRASEEVISIEVIKPSLVDNSVAIRLDDLARRVTGLNVADGQASIRAGSAWSYSIGSRVNIVLDGQSLLTPDRSSVKWQYLPLESVGQIEVLKGASSILYGSSAMNGTIHLRTIKPRKTPENKIVAYSGFLDDYTNDLYNWWNRPRMTSGGYFSRAHKASDNFEYVVGVNANYSQLPYYSYNDFFIRGNLYTRWTLQRNGKDNAGFHLNYSYINENDFIFWEGPDEKVLFPIEDLDFQYQTLNLDPYYARYDKKNNRHLIQGRLYLYKPDGTRKGGFVNAEYQFSKQWKNDWSIVAGGLQEVLLWYDRGLDPQFTYALKWAAYAQVDRKWAKLSITGGIRSEIFKLPGDIGAAYAFVSTSDNGNVQEIPVPLMRFGLNYRPRKNTFVRFNIGQAFRLPSLVESFVDFEFSGLSILANDALRPEYGWTSELGFKQNWGINKTYSGSMDVAIFWQEYKDLIEFQPTLSPVLALVPVNLPTARIAGYEATIKQSINKGQHRLNMDFGYTYAFPVELSGQEGVEYRNVGRYIRDLFKYAGKISETPKSIQREAILKYRNRHLVNAVMEYENDHFLFGFYGRYYSIIENGDFEFDSDVFSFIPGITEYWEAKFPEGDFVADITVGVKLNKTHLVSLTVKNFTNREYSLRLAKIEPSRSFIWKYQYTF
jgi:iron complex outermembrane receptor protein